MIPRSILDRKESPSSFSFYLHLDPLCVCGLIDFFNYRDNDQSCKDRIFQAEYPLKFQSSGALDGKYDVCYTNGARDGKPACGDLQSLVT